MILKLLNKKSTILLYNIIIHYKTLFNAKKSKSLMKNLMNIYNKINTLYNYYLSYHKYNKISCFQKCL